MRAKFSDQTTTKIITVGREFAIYKTGCTVVIYIKMKVLLIISFVFTLVYCRQGFGPGEQEWDFAEVRSGAHMFWWLYYTTDKNVVNPEDRPLLLWLQGGPGASSTGYGNFKEIGPLDDDLKPRNFTWVKDYNVMFVDNPVGTGYSYVDSSSLLTRNNNQIAKDLVELMRQFYKKLPKFQETPVYIMSESYGGKMTAEFALEFDKAIKNNNINGNLKGVGLGDSWISPIDSVMTWGPYLLQLGAVDNKGFKRIMRAANLTQQAVQSGNFLEATSLWGSTEGEILSVTDGIDFYNVLTKIEHYLKNKNYHNTRILPSVRSDFTKAFIDDIMNKQVKEALNIPGHLQWHESSGSVFSALRGDFMRPVTDVVEKLLNQTNIKVFVYSGQLDLIVDTPGTYDWVERLKWQDKSKWDSSTREPLVSREGYIEGYMKEYGNFGMYWINRAGHMVPADNPLAMEVLLKRLVGN